MTEKEPLTLLNDAVAAMMDERNDQTHTIINDAQVCGSGRIMSVQRLDHDMPCDIVRISIAPQDLGRIVEMKCGGVAAYNVQRMGIGGRPYYQNLCNRCWSSYVTTSLHLLSKVVVATT